jgi:tripartite-type tricarboxylate transporter receptor subunit TctC
MPFNAIKDFAPITLAAELQNVLVVNASLSVKNLSEFVLYARAHPGQLSYGSSGNGTSQHLAGEMFKRVSQIDVVHVPYKGLSQAVQALMSGDLQFMFSTVSDALPHIHSGKLRAIGLASLKRSSLLPEVTPIAELGYPGFNVVSWFGFVAPAGTPVEIVKRYNQELVSCLEEPQMRAKLAQMGLEVSTDTPEQFASFIQSEIIKWAPLVKDSTTLEP